MPKSLNRTDADRGGRQSWCDTALARAASARFVGFGDPSRVLLAGDTHGNLRWMTTLARLADRHGCQGIVQVGDFGYWSHTAAGERFLDNVERQLERYGLWLVFSPGNHDNHELLARHRRDAGGMVVIRDRIVSAPFGTRFVWGGVRFATLGGAFSVDWAPDLEAGWAGRTPGVDWWPGLEEPSETDAQRRGDEPLDVLITHDAPDGVDLGPRVALRPEDEWRSLQTRKLLLSVVKRLHPKLVVHGHWHRRASSVVATTDPLRSEAEDQVVWSQGAFQTRTATCCAAARRGAPAQVSGGAPNSAAADWKPLWSHTQVEGLAADIQANTGSWALLVLADDGSFRFVAGARAAVAALG